MKYSRRRFLVFLGLIFAALLLVSCQGSGDDDDDSGANGDDDAPDDDTTDDDGSIDDDFDDDADDDVDDDTTDDDTTADDDTDAVVFVQFTDIHQSRGSGTEQGTYENWFRSVQYVHDVVRPDFVVTTGDLTDGGLNGGQQAQADWDDYHNAVLNAGFTAADYHDLPGNHDIHGDPDFTFYLANGISGEIRYSWTIERGEYQYAFLDVQTVHPDRMEGSFTEADYTWTDNELAQYADYTHIFLFAHHNGFIVPDAGLLGADGLVADYEATAFVAGHRHLDLEQTENGMRYLKTATQMKGMPTSEAGWMRIFVLTGQVWACASKWVVEEGPQVITTSPQDERLAVARSPEGHIVSGETTVTAMAFADETVELLMTVDSGEAIAMQTDDGRIYYAPFDFSALAAGPHTIRVEDVNRINRVNGIDEIQIETN